MRSERHVRCLAFFEPSQLGSLLFFGKFVPEASCCLSCLSKGSAVALLTHLARGRDSIVGLAMECDEQKNGARVEKTLRHATAANDEEECQCRRYSDR